MRDKWGKYDKLYEKGCWWDERKCDVEKNSKKGPKKYLNSETNIDLEIRVRDFPFSPQPFVSFFLVHFVCWFLFDV